MTNRYQINQPESLLSPSLVVFRDLVQQNIATMIRLAGGCDRLRPHCKTHKMPDITRMQLAAGITRHKAATFAEAEMLARVGVKDIFLAYNIVGPNIDRTIRFRKAFPEVTFMVSADHARPVAELGQAAHAAGITIEVLLDLDVGMHRTGIAISPAAEALYATIASTPGLSVAGLQVYDGHNSSAELETRQKVVADTWHEVARFVATLEAKGLPVPRLVCGGTGSILPYFALNDRRIEQSAGTVVLYDTGYGDRFADLSDFVPAALLLTRVISVTGENLFTLDAGHKSVSPDQPLGSRIRLLDHPQAKTLLQSEEHLTIETAEPHSHQPGDVLLGIPRHICTSTYLHEFVYVVENGVLVDKWKVLARDRQLTI